MNEDKKLEKSLEKVNRLEIIDYTLELEEGGGRAYVKWEDKLNIMLSFQDGGKTLKIVFLKEKTDGGK